MIVPHMPPESSIGYCRTRLSVTFTKLSLIAEMVPQYLSSVSWSRTSRLAMMLWLRVSRIWWRIFSASAPWTKFSRSRLIDLLEVVLEVLLGAVVVDQVLDDETRELVDARVDGEPLVDDLATEDVFEPCVHGSPSCLPKPRGDHAHDAVELAVQAAADAGRIQLNLDLAVNAAPHRAVLPAVAGDGRHLLDDLPGLLLFRR